MEKSKKDNPPYIANRIKAFLGLKIYDESEFMDFIEKKDNLTPYDLQKYLGLGNKRAEMLYAKLREEGKIKTPQEKILEELSDKENAKIRAKESADRLRKIKKLLATLDRSEVTPCPKCKNKDYVVRITFGMIAARDDEEYKEWSSVGLLPGGRYSRGCVITPGGMWICKKCSTEFYGNGEEVPANTSLDEYYNEFL